MNRNCLKVILIMILAALGGIISTSPIYSSYAQPSEEWSKTLGGRDWDVSYSVQQTDDGGYIIAGYTESSGAGAEDVYLVKTDAKGRELWSRTFGGSEYDCGYSVQQTTDGGYIIAGETWSFGGGEGDVYLIKTDFGGDETWSKTFGGSSYDYAYSVQQTTDGGYIIAGETWSFDSIGGDVYLIKTDSDGNKVWGRYGGGSYTDSGWSVQETTDGGYIVVGHTDSFGAVGYDAYLVKIDAEGGRMWNKTFGGSGDDEFMSVQQTTDGGYIMVGDICNSGTDVHDVYLVKTDTEGNELWSKTFGGQKDDFGHSVQQTSDGGYIIAGDTNSFGKGAYDVYLIKTDSEGNELWSRTFGDSDDDTGWCVKQTIDGGYIIAAETWNPRADDVDAYLIKVTPEGEPEPESQPEPEPEQEEGRCIIATTTYGSELSPEVQFLRTFRDEYVLNTYAGKNFMTIFNAWYYSFSPGVASKISENNGLRGFMKILLYPLMGILHLTSMTIALFSFNHELAIVISGFIASSLIGIVYFMPLALIPFLIMKKKVPTQILRAVSFIWITSAGLIAAAEISKLSALMILSTALFVLTTITLATLISIKHITRHVNFLRSF